MATLRDDLQTRLAHARHTAGALGRHFSRDGRGSVSLELVLVLPLLLWALVATVIFYEGYQARYHAQMAAQTVADIMSRETNLFTANYVEGLNDVFDFLADSNYDTRLRVSSVIWDSTNERNRLQWSYGTRNLTELPEATFQYLADGDYEGLLAEFGEDESFSFASAAAQAPVDDLADRIPPVLPGEALLVVEAFSLWEPFAAVGIGQLRFAPVVVVRPRFAPWINFDGIETVFPETDYEVAWTGSGNDTLPDITEPDPDPTPSGQVSAFTFDDGVTTGLSRTTVTSGGPSGSYLGPFGGETWATPVTLPVSLSAANMNVTIAFDLLVIDSWDGYDASWAAQPGDSFQIQLSGTPITHETFEVWKRAPFGNNRVAAGYYQGGTYRVTTSLVQSDSNIMGDWYNDQIWHVVVTLNNAPQNFTLGFSAALNEALANESWGIDNLTVTASGSGTAAPFTPNAATRNGTYPQTRFPRYLGCPEYRNPAPWMTMTRGDLSTGVTMRRQIGGTTYLGNCGGGWGYFNAAPHMVLNYDSQSISSTTSGLQFRMDDGNNGYSCDSVLVVRDPNGQWYFNDDYTGWNAGLQITNAPTGQWVVFLGTYNNGTCDSTLTINQFQR
ncbi:hypothetical protein LCM17_06125 [Cereibacter sphaeroides]|nr:hypothetical protein [Cereibacter sphaeroides]